MVYINGVILVMCSLCNIFTIVFTLVFVDGIIFVMYGEVMPYSNISITKVVVFLAIILADIVRPRCVIEIGPAIFQTTAKR